MVMMMEMLVLVVMTQSFIQAVLMAVALSAYAISRYLPVALEVGIVVTFAFLSTATTVVGSFAVVLVISAPEESIWSSAWMDG